MALSILFVHGMRIGITDPDNGKTFWYYSVSRPVPSPDPAVEEHLGEVAIGEAAKLASDKGWRITKKEAFIGLVSG